MGVRGSCCEGLLLWFFEGGLIACVGLIRNMHFVTVMSGAVSGAIRSYGYLGRAHLAGNH